MPFFGKPIKQLVFQDLEELVQSGAQENVRLEFKLADPGKDNYLKKLSSFANANGGYLVLGMKEGADNKAEELTGVSALPSFEAQITSWCTQEIYPPLMPVVSNPIEVPSKGTFAYVIYIEESELAPHFIEGRRGCYVRTNETSHRFEPRLADLREIQSLLNRRELSRRKLDELKERTAKRIGEREAVISRSGPTEPFLPLTIGVRPAFPSRSVIDLGRISEVVKTSSVISSGIFSRFPDPNGGFLPYSHADSIIFPRARHHQRGFLEVTRYGTTSYTEFMQPGPLQHRLEKQYSEHVKSAASIQSLLSVILLALKFGRNVVNHAPVYGLLDIEISLRSPASVAYCGFDSYGEPMYAAVQQTNDTARIKREIQTDVFKRSWSDLAFEMWRELYFSLGWEDAYSAAHDEWVRRNLSGALAGLAAGASSFLDA